MPLRSLGVRAALWGPVAAQMAIIFVASSIRNPERLPGDAPDWLAHGAAYAILGGLLLRAFASGERRGVTVATVGAAIVCAIAYGVSDEWHQSFVPGRSPSLVDLAADTLGAAAAAGVGWVWSAVTRPAV